MAAPAAITVRPRSTAIGRRDYEARNGPWRESHRGRDRAGCSGGYFAAAAFASLAHWGHHSGRTLMVPRRSARVRSP